jgi:serine/threonine-protein kinase SBK
LQPRARQPSTLNPKCSPRSSSSDSLTQQELDDHYTVLKELGSGTYGRSVHAQCHRTKAEIALKILPKSSVKLKDFLREFNYSYYLSPHRGIVNTFDVAFQTDDAFVFAQELAPMGDLFEAITPRIGLTELQAKAVARQIGSALEFMHSKFLVHRDVKPENVLIFDDKITKVKLMDFGMTKKAGTLVRKVSHGIPYTPPEICQATKGEHYSVECNADVWAYAVLLFCMLTGNFPWELAHDSDTYYHEYFGWQRRKSPKPPPQWRRFSARLLRLFRRMLEPRSDRRCSIKEISKYLDDVWMIQGPPSLPLHSRLPQPESQSSLTAERKASAPVGHTDEIATVEKTTERRVIRSARVDDRSKENRTEASQWISNQR